MLFLASTSFAQEISKEQVKQELLQYHKLESVSEFQLHPEKFKRWYNENTKFILLYSKFDCQWNFNLANGKLFTKCISTCWKDWEEELNKYLNYYCDAQIVFEGRNYTNNYFYKDYLIEVQWKDCLVNNIIVKDRSEFKKIYKK